VQRERSRSVEEAAGKLGVSVDALIKTLVVRRSEALYVLVCLPGSRSIDWGKLRGHLSERPATGYERGTITPFGAHGSRPVIIDTSLMAESAVAIGGGAHGVSIILDPAALAGAFAADVADVSKRAG
jgi:prolyl-tRNA editing enzyme YbaK/EbsC (Cys-tRNA(Pro) deacylase)